jgi:hypothetical protein
VRGEVKAARGLSMALPWLPRADEVRTVCRFGRFIRLGLSLRQFVDLLNESSKFLNYSAFYKVYLLVIFPSVLMNHLKTHTPKTFSSALSILSYFHKNLRICNLMHDSVATKAVL